MGLDMHLNAKRYLHYNDIESKENVNLHFNLPEGFEPKEKFSLTF
jgi:hypothetical protein